MRLRRYVGIVVLLTGLLAAASPAAADPDPDKAGGTAMLLCGEAGDHEVVIKNGGIHLLDSTSMFVPKEVQLLSRDGTTWNTVFLAPGADKNAIEEVMCEWVGPLSGRHFRAEGFFTPPQP